MRDWATVDWDNATSFTILLGGDISVDDSLELLRELNSLDEDVSASPAGAGPMEDIVIGVTIFKSAVEATKYAIAAVKIVQQWIAKLQKKGVEPNVRLENGRMDGISITVDADDDVDVTVIVRRRRHAEETEA